MTYPDPFRRPERPAYLSAAPPLSDRQRMASARRLRTLAPRLPSTQAQRIVAGDDGVAVLWCLACGQSHFTPWDQVTVERAGRDVPAPWVATFDDPNNDAYRLATGLTDHQVAYAFSEGATAVGITPDEREAVIGIQSLDDLDDPLMFAAWFRDDPAGWTKDNSTGDDAA